MCSETSPLQIGGSFSTHSWQMSPNAQEVDVQLCGQRRRRIEGRQREDKGRESRWGGQGGGGDICQEGWLGLTLEGIEGRKKVSQAFLIPIYQSLPFPLHRFHTASGLTLSFFSFSSPVLDFSHGVTFVFLTKLYMSSGLSSFSLDPFIALYLSLAPFFSTSASLCVLFNHFHMASSFHRESLPSHWCQRCLDCAALPSEWVSNADIGTACQGYGITLKPVAAKKHEYMSAATHSCKT